MTASKKKMSAVWAVQLHYTLIVQVNPTLLTSMVQFIVWLDLEWFIVMLDLRRGRHKNRTIIMTDISNWVVKIRDQFRQQINARHTTS